MEFVPLRLVSCKAWNRGSKPDTGHHQTRGSKTQYFRPLTAASLRESKSKHATVSAAQAMTT